MSKCEQARSAQKVTCWDLRKCCNIMPRLRVIEREKKNFLLAKLKKILKMMKKKGKWYRICWQEPSQKDEGSKEGLPEKMDGKRI